MIKKRWRSRKVRNRKAGKRKEVFAVSILSVAALGASITWCRATNGEMRGLNMNTEPLVVLSEKQPLEDSYPLVVENEHNDVNAMEENRFSDKIPLDYAKQKQVRAWCEQYEVPYPIALAVIQTESSFNPEAVNGNSKGYMQISTVNAEWLMEEIGITDLDDPYQNLHSGVFMLGDLYKRYEDWHMALTAYNFGPTGAYRYVFSKGMKNSRFSRLVMERSEEWMEVVADD